MTRVIAMALLAVALSACGQKGALYLPDESTPVLVTPTSPVTVVPPAPTQESEAQPPAGASQTSKSQTERSKSSK
ncbi:MAG: lipoprotein [Steroidobacteraceae bacterium]